MSLAQHPLGQSTFLSIRNQLTDRITCTVCLGDLIQPKTCMTCKKSFCSKCINVTSIY